MIGGMSHVKAIPRAPPTPPPRPAVLAAGEPCLAASPEGGFAGELNCMRKHAAKGTGPASLVPGTLRVVSARPDYRPDAAGSWSILADGGKAFVARIGTVVESRGNDA